MKEKTKKAQEKERNEQDLNFYGSEGGEKMKNTHEASLKKKSFYYFLLLLFFPPDFYNGGFFSLFSHIWNTLWLFKRRRTESSPFGRSLETSLEEEEWDVVTAESFFLSLFSFSPPSPPFPIISTNVREAVLQSTFDLGKWRGRCLYRICFLQVNRFYYQMMTNFQKFKSV